VRRLLRVTVTALAVGSAGLAYVMVRAARRVARTAEFGHQPGCICDDCPAVGIPDTVAEMWPGLFAGDQR
jgi:hypothetical protein